MAKQTQDVVRFLLSMGEAYGISMENGDLTLSDGVNFIESLSLLDDAVEDVELVPHELATWKPSDTAELIELSKEFDIPQEHAEELVKDALKISPLIVEFLAKWRRG